MAGDFVDESQASNVMLRATRNPARRNMPWRAFCAALALAGCAPSATAAASTSLKVQAPTPTAGSYPHYSALNLNDIPWHTAAGGWGPQVRLEAPALPVTTRSVTVNSRTEFNSAASVAGTRITVATGWPGNTVATINANDIDVIIPAGVAITARPHGQLPARRYRA